MRSIKADAQAATSGQREEHWQDWLRVVAATVLSVAALASAWSGYQSGLWNGLQTFRLAEMASIGRRAAEKTMVASQMRTMDVLVSLEYLRALSEGKQQQAAFLFQRFRPELKEATKAWLATHPQENPAAPPTPLAMKEYSLAADQEAAQLREEGEKAFTAAEVANATGETYLLLTLLCSLVMFLGGIATAFKGWRLNIVLLTLAVLVMVWTAARMVVLPLAVR